MRQGRMLEDMWLLIPLCWMPIGIMFAWTILLIQLRLGMLPGWMTQHPGIGLSPLIFMPFMPDTGDGLRLVSFSCGIAIGLWLVAHAGEYPVFEPADPPVAESRVSCDGMTTFVRPFLKDNGPLTGSPRRMLDRTWRRIPSRYRFLEPTGLFEKTIRGHRMLLAVGHTTGLGAILYEDGMYPRREIERFRTKTLPYPLREYGMPSDADPDSFMRSCMLLYGAELIIREGARLKGAKHPMIAWLDYRYRFHRIRTCLDNDWYYPPIRDLDPDGIIPRARETYDGLLREHEIEGALTNMLRIAGRIHDATRK